MDTNRDLFNQIISERNKALLIQESQNKAKKDIFNQVEKELPTLVRSYVKSQIPKQLTADEISDLVDSIVKKNTPKTVERIIEKPIEKTIIQKVESQDNKKYAEKSEIQELKDQLKGIKQTTSESNQNIRVVGDMLPNYSTQQGSVLTARGGRLVWEASSSGSTSSNYMDVKFVSSDYSMSSSDCLILCDCTAGNVSVTLPDAENLTGRIFIVKRIDDSNNTVTVDTVSLQTIDGNLTNEISFINTSVSVVSDGFNWRII